MVAADRVIFLFSDERALYGEAIEMLDQDKIRNAAEKAWGATKRDTGALVLARRPAKSPSRLGKQDVSGASAPKTRPSTYSRDSTTPGQPSSTSTAPTTGTANPKRRCRP